MSSKTQEEVLNSFQLPYLEGLDSNGKRQICPLTGEEKTYLPSLKECCLLWEQANVLQGHYQES